MNTNPQTDNGKKPIPPALPGVKATNPVATTAAITTPTPPTIIPAATATATSTDNTSPASGSAATQQDSSNYDIPDGVKEKHPDLIELILATKSMNEKEKQYWFHILPVMKEQQVEKLRKILINEKQKLAEIDKKYSQKLSTAQADKVSDWKGEDFKEKLVTIKEAELTAEEQEKAHEEELLNQMDSL